MILAMRAFWSTVFFFLRVVVSCCLPPDVLLANLLEPAPAPELLVVVVEVDEDEEEDEEDVLELGLISR